MTNALNDWIPNEVCFEKGMHNKCSRGFIRINHIPVETDFFREDELLDTTNIDLTELIHEEA